MVIIGDAERDAYGGAGHFRVALFDHSLRVALFCTLHGMMSMLPYRLGLDEGFRVRH